MMANDVWLRMLQHVFLCGKKVTVRDQLTLEVSPYFTQVGMDYPIVSVFERKLSYAHMATEANWIIQGRWELAYISQHCPKYEQFSDDGLTLNGAYGPPFRDQLDYVCDLLRRDPTTRQAIMTLWKANPQRSKDIPCTVSIQFLIRDEQINTIVNMRSSDAWLGWPYDVFCFTMMTWMVAFKIPNQLMPGILTIFTGSQHLYERDLVRAQRCIMYPESLKYSPIYLTNINTPAHLYSCLDDLRCNTECHPYFLPEFRNHLRSKPNHATNLKGSETTHIKE